MDISASVDIEILKYCNTKIPAVGSRNRQMIITRHRSVPKRMTTGMKRKPSNRATAVQAAIAQKESACKGEMDSKDKSRAPSKDESCLLYTSRCV